uniref:3-dehydroquinate synthase II n=1 Tax=Paractinoplanes polyasparticus TaxID=2856853 RepID=UPI001C85C742|nr:3-dehydroquinate synthase II [Actinoplanes polyasparticus]
MKEVWIDIRNTGDLKPAIVTEAIHHRASAIVSDSLSDLAGLPPTIMKVYFPTDGRLPEDAGDCDLVVADRSTLDVTEAGPRFASFVEITDAATLELACQSAKSEPWSILLFRDPTKIPLEIVLAAAAAADGGIVTVAADVTEAEVVFGVLEHGSGVLIRPIGVGDVAKVIEAAASSSPDVSLVELEVLRTSHVGMGERVCVDTCTYFRKDEGILVGSHSKGMVLCVSETHPLPYMPTRPFRVNAGAIHSYTLADQERTQYLSELRAGSKVLAVDINGKTRVSTVGRVKIESRPLLSVDAVAPDGTEVNLILQDDWHVRVLGPGGTVHNCTELKAGDKILGYLPQADRHVGYPIDEFCIEK